MCCPIDTHKSEEERTRPLRAQTPQGAEARLRSGFEWLYPALLGEPKSMFENRQIAYLSSLCSNKCFETLHIRDGLRAAAPGRQRRTLHCLHPVSQTAWQGKKDHKQVILMPLKWSGIPAHSSDYCRKIDETICILLTMRMRNQKAY